MTLNEVQPWLRAWPLQRPRVKVTPTSSPNQRASFRKALFLVLSCCKSEPPPMQRDAQSSSP